MLRETWEKMEAKVKTDLKNWVIKMQTGLKCLKMWHNGGLLRTQNRSFFSYMTCNFSEKDAFSVELLCTVGITMLKDSMLFENRHFTRGDGSVYKINIPAFMCKALGSHEEAQLSRFVGLCKFQQVPSY
jgi:hypothetical protein